MDARRSLSALLVLLSLPGIAAGAAPAAAAQPAAPTPAQVQTLTLHYQERPPYMSTLADGSVGGLVAEPAAQALARAGIAFQWVCTPPHRQLALIQEGRGLHCGVGWFRNAQRAQRGKFSQPLYRDRPLGAIAQPALARPGPVRAVDWVQQAGGGLLLTDGYTYGSVLDEAIAGLAPPPPRTLVEPLQMLRMIVAGRAAAMLVAPEEAQTLLALPEFAPRRLQTVTFSDVGPGETRHLYCNRAVPDEWLGRIDRALTR